MMIPRSKNILIVGVAAFIALAIVLIVLLTRDKTQNESSAKSEIDQIFESGQGALPHKLPNVSVKGQVKNKQGQNVNGTITIGNREAQVTNGNFSYSDFVVSVYYVKFTDSSNKVQKVSPSPVEVFGDSEFEFVLAE